MSVEQAENIRRQYEEMRREKESELDRHRNFEDGKPVTMEEINQHVEKTERLQREVQEARMAEQKAEQQVAEERRKEQMVEEAKEEARKEQQMHEEMERRMQEEISKRNSYSL